MGIAPLLSGPVSISVTSSPAGVVHTDTLVDQFFQRTDLLRLDRLEMAEIETPAADISTSEPFWLTCSPSTWRSARMATDALPSGCALVASRTSPFNHGPDAAPLLQTAPLTNQLHDAVRCTGLWCRAHQSATPANFPQIPLSPI